MGPSSRTSSCRVRGAAKPTRGTIVSLKHETRFCTAPDGVGLAYAIEGEGSPPVKAGNWMTHLDYDRQSPI
jgi:hypothetical protein